MAVDASQPYSPGWWLVRLSAKLAARSHRTRLLTDYRDGRAPLPEGAEGVREAYRTFQRRARTNFAELVVEAVLERMVPAGQRPTTTGEEADTAAAAMSRTVEANTLDLLLGDVLDDMLTTGDGYALVGPPDKGSDTAVITHEDPETITTAHDARRPDRILAALKVLRDDITEQDVAYLYLPGAVWVATHDIGTTTGDEDWASFAQTDPDTIARYWTPDEDRTIQLPSPLRDVIPVVRFRNRRGRGEFETHLDVLDRINYVILQQLVVAAMQAYRQRATKGDLPELDEGGEPIDYSALFRPGPGALWQLPEGVELWESAPTDITPLLTQAEGYIRHLAAVTRTPMSVLLPDHANQSAEGAAFAREGLIFKTRDRLRRATHGRQRIAELALRMSNQPAASLEALWLPPERLTLSERADAATKARDDIPWRTRLTDLWGFAPEDVDRMAAERADEQLSALTLTNPQPPEPTGGGGDGRG